MFFTVRAILEWVMQKNYEVVGQSKYITRITTLCFITPVIDNGCFSMMK